jgi:hypothetical protein
MHAVLDDIMHARMSVRHAYTLVATSSLTICSVLLHPAVPWYEYLMRAEIRWIQKVC